MTNIVVDSSAIFAVLSNEESAPQLIEIFSSHQAYISATTLAEISIVCETRGIGALLDEFLHEIKPIVVDVDRTQADAMRMAYMRWGKGRHPAGLNFSDCFAYVLSKKLGFPLLFVGNDFSRTDVIQLPATET